VVGEQYMSKKLHWLLLKTEKFQDFIYHPEFEVTQYFSNCVSFSYAKWWETLPLLGQLGRPNLNHWSID
jgi:hypothetical protein